MIKIGLIGAGGIARVHHAPAFKRYPARCEVVAVAEPNDEVRKTFVEQFGVPEQFDSYEAMLANADLDAVVVCTPNLHHCKPTIAAFQAGKHVLCEKPLGMTGDESYRMVKAAKEAGKILQVGLQQRFSGAGAALLNYVKAGSMGEVYYARALAIRRRGVPSWGVFIDREKQGGGAMIDVGVHILDLTLAAMGYPKPITASACSWDQLGKNPDLFNQFGDYDRSKFTVEDFAAGFIRFENGAAVTLESSFMANMPNAFEAQLFGLKSGVVIKPSEADLRIYTEANRQLQDITVANIGKTEAQFLAAEAFLDAVEGKSPCQVPGEHGYILNAIFDAMYKSAASGHEEPVGIQPIG